MLGNSKGSAQEGSLLPVQHLHRQMEPLSECVATAHVELRTTECILFRGNNNKDAWIALLLIS